MVNSGYEPRPPPAASLARAKHAEYPQDLPPVAGVSAFIALMLIVLPWLRSLTNLVSWVLVTTTQSRTRHFNQCQTACPFTPETFPSVGSFNCRQGVTLIVVAQPPPSATKSPTGNSCSPSPRSCAASSASAATSSPSFSTTPPPSFGFTG